MGVISPIALGVAIYILILPIHEWDGKMLPIICAIIIVQMVTLILDLIANRIADKIKELDREFSSRKADLVLQCERDVKEKRIELYRQLEQCERDIKDKQSELAKERRMFDAEITQRQDELIKHQRQIDEREKELIENLEYRENKIKEAIESHQILNYVSKMYADTCTWNLHVSERMLREKQRPANKAADEVKKLKQEIAPFIQEARKDRYKLEFLLNVFPDLHKYIDDDTDDSILSLSEYGNMEEYSEHYDRRYDYLTKDEWEQLSESEKSQLALDRYNERDKSNWVIGIEYEMYIESLLRSEGYLTIPHGSLRGLNDLGRDIIAKKIIDGKIHVLIIQCKRYSAQKEIHENTICQLYGTAIEYELTNANNDEIISAVLYTTAPLSLTAQRFAERLNVKVVVQKHGNFPQIKCNIGNNGEKIYHLPFDQQYYNTIVDKKGELFASSVKEAEDYGFRRAKRYIPPGGSN